PPVMGAGISGVTLPAQVTATAYLRAKPFVGGEILNLNLEAGRSVTAVRRTDGWVQVVAGDQTGWVTADALKILGPIPSLPAVQ
ncbi:MAG TPA: SH3 domain-containing protein, partial [Phototrophicaceae bacterium]|nr:SH3 domain-containing protein [Phototrophicaceae bacterium]